jgi:hypothetical protein
MCFASIWVNNALNFRLKWQKYTDLDIKRVYFTLKLKNGFGVGNWRAEDLLELWEMKQFLML